jgi:hypothetical protein
MKNKHALLSIIGLLFLSACCGQVPKLGEQAMNSCCTQLDSLTAIVSRLQQQNDSMRQLILPVVSKNEQKLMMNRLGKKQYAILSNPDSIKIFAIDGFPAEKPTKGADEIEEYKIKQMGGILSNKQEPTLKKILLNPRNYEGPKTSCIFSPGVALQFVKNKEIVHVLICFTCDEWAFFYKGKTVHYPSKKARQELLQFIKPYFKTISEIQNLK